MDISKKLSEDLKNALRSGERDKLSVIRMVKAGIKNKEIEKMSPLDEEEVYALLNSMIRQRKDSIEQFLKGEREDLVKQEEKELSIIQSYLPVQLTEDEVKEMITDTIGETGASSLRDTGKVMKIIIPRIKGRFDSKLLNELVKRALSETSRTEEG